MGFEIYSRKIQRGGEPRLSFTTLGRFSFNKSATAEFQKRAVENVFLMWDKEKRLIGVKAAAKKDPRTYKIHYGTKGNGCGFSASTFLKYIGFDDRETRSVPARWDEQEGMFIIEVPEQYLEGGKQEIVPLVIKERKRREPK
jgi:hypothetical protein